MSSAIRRSQLLILLLVVLLAGCTAQPEPDKSWRDCEVCPLLRAVPAGSFTMGSPPQESGRLVHEGPQHTVSFAAPFAIGVYEVTFAEWDACVDDGGCNIFPGDEGWGRDDRPVININLDEMNAYLHWLTTKTGHVYRLPSEAEWEYAARAGTATVYWWGNEADHDYANFGADECCRGAADGRDVWQDQTAPVGRFPANAFGLHDLHGNVYERVRDCWTPNYVAAPADGSAWLDGDCRAIGLRGGSWISSPELIRAAERDAFNGYYRANVMGFRVVRELD